MIRFNYCIGFLLLFCYEGVVSRFAGSDVSGFLDGSGTNAVFNSPCGLTISNQGVLYVADSMNNRIRAITPAGKWNRIM